MNVAHGRKSDIKLLLATTKHQNFVRTTEKQGAMDSFFVNGSDSVVHARSLFSRFQSGTCYEQSCTDKFLKKAKSATVKSWQNHQ